MMRGLIKLPITYHVARHRNLKMAAVKGETALPLCYITHRNEIRSVN
jgi:hypothetical protein